MAFRRYETIKRLNYTHLGYIIKGFSARELSNRILADNTPTKMIEVAYEAIRKILKYILFQGIRLKNVYFSNSVHYGSRRDKTKLIDEFPMIEFHFDTRLRHTCPVLSCASIIARAYRDEIMWKWDFPEAAMLPPSKVLDHMFGFGHPSGDKVIQWFNEKKDVIFGYPSIVRFSHSTVQKIMDTEIIFIQWYDTEQKSRGELLMDVERERNYDLEWMKYRPQLEMGRVGVGDLLKLKRGWKTL